MPQSAGAVSLPAMDDLLTLPLVVAPTFLLAGLVKGVIGLGLPTVAVGLRGVVMTPAQAAALPRQRSGSGAPAVARRAVLAGRGEDREL